MAGTEPPGRPSAARNTQDRRLGSSGKERTMAIRDYGFVNRSQEQARLARERAEALQAEADREHARMEAAKGFTPAEAQAKREAQHREQQQRKQAAKERNLKAALKSRYLSVPGTTADDFEEEYPRLLKEHAAKVAAGESAEIPAVASEFADPKMWGL